MNIIQIELNNQHILIHEVTSHPSRLSSTGASDFVLIMTTASDTIGTGSFQCDLTEIFESNPSLLCCHPPRGNFRPTANLTCHRHHLKKKQPKKKQPQGLWYWPWQPLWSFTTPRLDSRCFFVKRLNGSDWYRGCETRLCPTGSSQQHPLFQPQNNFQRSFVSSFWRKHALR